jgi:GNAT superfamily N-acetyltransferase
MASSPPTATLTPRTWTRDNSPFFISNDPKFISVKEVNEAFAKDFLYWTKPFPEDVLHQMLHGSMSFGVYRWLEPQQSQTEPVTLTTENTEQIGLARVITDGVSFGYLSDTYILPEYQGDGLGRWLMECVAEVFSKESMPHLRRVILLTSGERLQEFYGQTLGMKVVGQEERPDIGKTLVYMNARPTAKPGSC